MTTPETTDRRLRAAGPIEKLPWQLRTDADEMNGWGAGNKAEHARQAADEIERLRAVIRVNMLRLDFTISHEEIDRVINGR